LKIIGTMSAGYEHIAISECAKLGIKIGYTPDTLSDATAELGMALLLATSRRIPEGKTDLHSDTEFYIMFPIVIDYTKNFCCSIITAKYSCLILCQIWRRFFYICCLSY